LVSIIASAPMMQTASAARNENAARFGMIIGMFFKRFLMIFWALAGLLAYGLFKGQVHDPDLIWGYMTLHLLFPGAVGLMLAGILAANMSTLAAASVTHSALFIRNLYQPFVSPKSERHLLAVGRVVIAVVLAGGIGAALFVGNLLDLFKYFISMPAVFGAAIWLGFVWRRLTKKAVVAQIFVCFIIYAVIPNLFQSWDWARTNPAFLRETKAQVVRITTRALEEDVEAGRAGAVGDEIEKRHRVEPAAIFFEKVARIDPGDPASAKIGLGRFEAEIWVLSGFGIDFSRFTKAQLVATRFFFDALFPFVLLFLLSALTRPVAKSHLDGFFAKVHTPVAPSPEEDERAVREARTHPERIEMRKLRPGSNWELMKPGRADVLGFGGTWVLVGVILALLWLMVSIR
ncbi:MAG: sodium:solute symporter family protein, partial [Candidatus Aminicenantes bacterium]|nr:sodium:solute symporter family protein [Candidatus Aminicenantes bacterium]